MAPTITPVKAEVISFRCHCAVQQWINVKKTKPKKKPKKKPHTHGRWLVALRYGSNLFWFFSHLTLSFVVNNLIKKNLPILYLLRNSTYLSLLASTFMQHVTFKAMCWEFSHLTPSSRSSSPLLHKMVASQRWKTLPLSNPPPTLTSTKGDSQPILICADEDDITVLCF